MKSLDNRLDNVIQGNKVGMVFLDILEDKLIPDNR